MQQQMNDLNRRLHAVVQRMSAFDRYKRKMKKKKWVAQRDDTESSPLSQQVKQSPAQIIEPTGLDTQQPSQQHVSSQERIRLALLQAEIDDGLKRLANGHEWKSLANKMFKNIKVCKEMASILRGEHSNEEDEKQQQQPQQQDEQPDEELKELLDIIKEVVKPRKEESLRVVPKLSETILPPKKRLGEEREQEQRAGTDEQLRITLAQIDERYARAVEQTRAQHSQIKEQHALEDKRQDEMEDRYQQENALIYRQIGKLRTDREWQKEWRNRRSLVVQRRVDQSANAG